jgi:hypothetical protein
VKVKSRVKVNLQSEEQHRLTLGEAAVIRNIYMRKFSMEFGGDQGPAGHRQPFTTRMKAGPILSGVLSPVVQPSTTLFQVFAKVLSAILPRSCRI